MTPPSLPPLERLLFRVVAVTCLLFAVLTPPFQAPDESLHFSRTYQIAHGGVFARRQGAAVGGIEPAGYARLSERDLRREPFDVFTRYSPAQVLAAMRPRPGDERPTFIEFANVASYPPTMYVPQALALALGGAAGLWPLACLYLARLFNALAFLALLWGAVRALPFGRPALLAVAALPTVAYQSASVSPDATIVGVAWLAIALSLRLGYAAARGTRGTRGAALAVVAVPLGLAKGLYAPLALAGARRANWRAHAIALVIALAAFAAWTSRAGGQSVFEVVSRRTGQLEMTAPMDAQLQVVLAAPFRFARVLVSSMVERSPVYLLQIVGRFGWNAFLLPLAAYALAPAMLAAGIVAGLGRRVDGWSRGWWAVLAIGGAVLVETALYLTGTPLGADYVQGTQGRYFLPLLPLLALALAPARGRPGALRFVAGAALLLEGVALLTAADSFWWHGYVNHHGLPPVSRDAAGLLRALLLPSPRW